MKPINFSNKRTLTALACLTLLAACGPMDNRYDDSNGYYTSGRDDHYPALVGRAPDYERYVTYGDHDDHYSRDGRLHQPYGRRTITLNNGQKIPEYMFPERGMCRVWFADRLNVNQPNIQSCEYVRSRPVPKGAYVIYGR